MLVNLLVYSMLDHILVCMMLNLLAPVVHVCLCLSVYSGVQSTTLVSDDVHVAGRLVPLLVGAADGAGGDKHESRGSGRG